MDNIDINKINEYGVHVLRAFARSLHIPSPTTKKKEELIQAIIDCCTGKSYYDPSTVSRKGRPVKIQMNTDGLNVVQSIESDDANHRPYDSYPREMFEPYRLNSSIKAEYTCDSGELVLVEGCIDIVSKGYGILRVSDYSPSSLDVYVDALIVAKHDIKMGDIIKGYMTKLVKDNIYVLKSIVSINNSQDRLFDFDKSKYQPLSDSITLSRDVSISLGSRNYMRIGTSVALTYASTIAECQVVFLDIKARPEMSISSTDSLIYIPMYFNRSEHDIISCTNLVTAMCKRHVELGKKVVLFINNFSELLKVYNIAYTKKYDLDTFDYQAINSIQNLLFSAKYIDDSSSLTMVCVDKDSVTSSVANVINNEFMDEFHTVI